jgi:amino acid transporter
MSEKQHESWGGAPFIEVEDRQLLQTLRWYDGFVVSLACPSFLLGAMGFTFASLGTWGTVVFWTISMLIGALMAFIYQEPAMMFPDKSGGIALYANEGWKRYTTLAGPIATFGYWFAWSAVLAINGFLIGNLVVAQWLPENTWEIGSAGAPGHITLAKIIGIICIAAIWLVNTRGMRIGVNLTYVTGALLMIPLAVVMFGGFATGNFHSSNLTWTVEGTDGWTLGLVWLYLMGWSSYGVETVAAFAPEYKQKHDTRKALLSASGFSLLIYFFVPLGVAGTLTDKEISDGATGAYIVTALQKIIGGGSGALSSIFLILLIAGLLLAMNTATMDGSRALYGISREGLTVKWLGVLNKHHVPERAMTVDSLFNILLLIIFDSNLIIFAASNLGYILCHVLALTAVLLLRKDRPNWPRPYKLNGFWLVMAALLAALNLVLIFFGIWYFDLTGYASGSMIFGISRELFLGPLVLLIGVAFYVYRRVGQDKKKFIWVDKSEQIPPVVEFHQS